MGMPGNIAAAAAVAATAAAVALALGDPSDSLFLLSGGISLRRESMRKERDILLTVEVAVEIDVELRLST